MEQIIKKLANIKSEQSVEKVWKNWSLDEIKKLLEIYSIICDKEEELYKLVYRYHGSDCYEDIFRDYDYTLLEDKAQGVKEALDTLNDIIKDDNK